MSIATGFCSVTFLSLMNVLATRSLKIALIKVSATGTYGKGTLNYSTLTGNSDEVSGAGYTAGGAALAGLAVAQGGTDNFVTYMTFTTPAWAAATFTCRGALIYDVTNGNAAVATIDFGETKTVVAGTFTVTLPAADYVNAALRFGL